MIKRLEALEQNYEKTLNELEETKHALNGAGDLVEKRLQIMEDLQSQLAELQRYEKLGEAIKELVPSVAPATATGDPQKLNLGTVPQLEITIDAEKISHHFKKDDPKSQVCHGIYLTTGRKRLGDIKSTMVDKGYKKAADDASGLLQELIEMGLVQEFNQDSSHKGYRLTPGIRWNFPKEEEKNE